VLSPVRTAVLQQNLLAKSLNNLKLPTVLFVEFNTTTELEILIELRDFVGVSAMSEVSVCKVVSIKITVL
jgi:hypothetical protein